MFLSQIRSCLDRGVLINVDAPGCGTSVVRGSTKHKYEGFHPGVQYPKVFSPEVATSRRVYIYLPRPNKKGRVALKRALRQNSALALIRLPFINN